ncbi:hypothetical protein KEM48_000497 [Puccinia striiformis f. sp. tritici PST-130]|nr:hypothetical protein KEM48_000497 [Puccinia striiformis f. sp. tritici PST-130]
MSTRSTNNPIYPLTDPERIIRAANAEKRRLTQLAGTLNPANSITFPTPSNSVDPMSSDPTNPTNPSASADSTTKQPTVPISDMTTEDMLRAVLQVQHASTLQTASRMERLEDALLELSLKPEPARAPERQLQLRPKTRTGMTITKHRSHITSNTVLVGRLKTELRRAAPDILSSIKALAFPPRQKTNHPQNKL